MSEGKQTIRVAVNVMRARQTVIGFNIAIVSFQIVQLYRAAGGISVQGFDHQIHVRADIALYMSLAISLIALLAMTMSSLMDEVGVCTHWSLVIGDVLMYLALAYTVSGFFSPLEESMRLFTANLPTQAVQAVILQKSVLVTAGIAWFLAMYVGPIVSLLRSPFPARINITLGFAYVAVLFVLAWINAQAGMVESVSLGKPAELSGAVLKEFVQPLDW
ncbi:MAG: hypothetical protein JRE16_10995 [Deltaproteobacteria bacterium]|jgi:hypothetical protein|nr:hypothetical protein [Deltaproteobacteria bacterium]